MENEFIKKINEVENRKYSYSEKDCTRDELKKRFIKERLDDILTCLEIKEQMENINHRTNKAIGLIEGKLKHAGREGRLEDGHMEFISDDTYYDLDLSDVTCSYKIKRCDTLEKK